MAAIVFPDSPANGETFKAQNGVTYTYDSVDDSWTGETNLDNNIGYPSINEFTSVPSFASGTGTQQDPFVITPATVALNASTKSAQTITVSSQTPGNVLSFVNHTTPNSVKSKFAQETGLVDVSGVYTFRLNYNDALGATTESLSTNVGILSLGSCYFSWTITQEA